MGNILNYAKEELRRIGYDESRIVKNEDADENTDPSEQWGLLVGRYVLELIEKFEEQGHSGCSAGTTVNLFKKLAMFEPLTPLTGEDDEWKEWEDYGNGKSRQNKRKSSVFQKEDGKAYQLDKYVFRQPDGLGYTGSDSFYDIPSFPYVPDTIEIKVDSDGNRLE